ncbi:lactate/malate family dehydrogenase [Megasphaera vaginalis (ex Bordigoni et al. 2020)]|uniref:lactate/malate family dehydrogenase n=1 Tax=Megasphaera vaginalis (ex Bordigoni et al. 2020) TaxID=2045301 RepID=UPI000C7C5155|nr:L-lactate dehydrogenase [Megasphaera vaginalis (ex Bordigoni et al. 2020)]
MKKRILGIIGAGHVGAHVAYAVGLKGSADEVRILDINENLLTSQCQDLMDAVKYMPHRISYGAATWADLRDCDLLVNALGPTERYVTEDRNDEMDYTVKAAALCGEEIKRCGFDGILLNITNPCDVVTAVLAARCGLPARRVFGTGTGLDTARLINFLAQSTGLSHGSITAYMMGEHGFAQMVPWSLVRFGGRPLTEVAAQAPFDFDRDRLRQQTIDAGWAVYSGKRATEYGICSTAMKIIDAVFHDTKEIMAVSAFLDGPYGQYGIYCGCPAVIGAVGVEKVMDYALTAEEEKEFRRCCRVVRDNIAAAESLLASEKAQVLDL